MGTVLIVHILVIPPEHYLTKQIPLGSIFQYWQVKALREKGINVGVISADFVPFRMNFSKYHYPYFEEDNGVPIYRYYKKIFIPGLFANKLLWKYIITMHLEIFNNYCHKQGMPDIIHAHNCLFSGVVALKIKERHNIPYIITEQSSLYAKGLVSGLGNKLTKEVLINADTITVVSKSHGKRLEDMFGADAYPNFPIFNIIDERFENKEIKLKGDNKINETFTFLSIGNLDHNKNHTDLLKAFASKFRDNSKVKLKIGGDGPLKKQLQKQINELHLIEQVLLIGPLSRDKVFWEMQNCNVFVLPSIVETFGVVLIEALALGKPTVATKCGGPEDIVNEKNGMLVPIKDVAALAEAMFSIYVNIGKYDARLIRNDCLERFGKDAFVKRIRNIYSNILEIEGHY